MANEDKKERTSINQSSFVQAMKLYLLTSSNPLAAVMDIDKRNRILKNYWKAIADILVEKADDETVIFKTIGLELFSLISPTIFNRLFTINDFRIDTIKNMLKAALQQLPPDYLQVQDPSWWRSGGGASNINKAAARKIAQELNKCINSPTVSSDNILI